MINEESVQAVNAAQWDEPFVRPLYESYCFSRLPQTIVHLLTGDGNSGLPDSVLGHLPRRYEKVVLLFIDAFGWRFFERYADRYPFLQRFIDQGVVSKLTAQFPSTTAAHTTTMHTGLPVGESGVYEWFYYEPLVDEIIAPMLFSYAGDRDRNTLIRTGIPPHEFYPTRTVYRTLLDQGVHSYIFQHRDYTPSPFSDVMFSGAKVSSYKTLSEALTNLGEAILSEPGSAYFFLYFDSIDSLAHAYGPDSPQFEAEVDTFCYAMERLFHNTLAGRAKNTLLLMTADHGQMETSPETAIYLNRLTPTIEPFIKTNRMGRLMVPAGSARDMFLYIKPEHLDETQRILSAQLEGHAAVYRVQDLIDQGLFGTGKPSATFLSRAGNLVILAYPKESIWWYERGRYEQRLYGHHGGLSREEVETILLALPYV